MIVTQQHKARICVPYYCLRRMFVLGRLVVGTALLYATDVITAILSRPLDFCAQQW
eukprot:COSAG02_NODE_2261_length_9322_cov_152.037298_6_plen_56_part_00